MSGYESTDPAKLLERVNRMTGQMVGTHIAILELVLAVGESNPEFRVRYAEKLERLVAALPAGMVPDDILTASSAVLSDIASALRARD